MGYIFGLLSLANSIFQLVNESDLGSYSKILFVSDKSNLLNLLSEIPWAIMNGLSVKSTSMVLALLNHPGRQLTFHHRGQ